MPCSNKRAALWWLLLAFVRPALAQSRPKTVNTENFSLLYLTMEALSVTSSGVGQPNSTVIVACVDNTGLSFNNISLNVADDAVTVSSSTATFSVGQHVGYLLYGRSIACSMDIQFRLPNTANLTDVSVLSAGNGSCWFSYNLFVSNSGSSTGSTSWTCSMSGVSYVLLCQDCNTATSSSSTSAKSGGLSAGQVQTVCIVIGCSLVVAFVVIFGCSRVSSWRAHDVRDTQHLPEDAAKEVNLRPPGFFVAVSASQRAIDSPRGPQPSVAEAALPPVVIVSYGSSSTPTADHFHHGTYALAKPEAAIQTQGSDFGQPEQAKQETLQPLQPVAQEASGANSAGIIGSAAAKHQEDL